MTVFATMWIRDGVLVNRMHVNPVAFAVAYWVFIPPEDRTKTSLEELINFGFAKSGVSCAEKMQLFNNENSGTLKTIDAAADFYNSLATEAAKSCTFFGGAVDLLRELQNAGGKNFITSAVEQSVLDAWKADSQGQMIASYITEILGKRPNFVKGLDHFKYASEQVGGEQIYYIADAVSEIATAREHSDACNIVPIGFANVIDKPQVIDAVRLVNESYTRCNRNSVPYPNFEAEVRSELLDLPEQVKLVQDLQLAGAQHVVSGEPNGILKNLSSYLQKEIHIAPNR